MPLLSNNTTCEDSWQTIAIAQRLPGPHKSWRTMTRLEDVNSGDTTPIRPAPNQEYCKPRTMSREYLCSLLLQGLDRIVAYAIMTVKTVGNGAKWVGPT